MEVREEEKPLEVLQLGLAAAGSWQLGLARLRQAPAVPNLEAVRAAQLGGPLESWLCPGVPQGFPVWWPRNATPVGCALELLEG